MITGSCYSSNNHTVHRVNESLSLHFTGFKILDGLFDELKEHHGFKDATDLLLSGGSAGKYHPFTIAHSVSNR